MATGFTTTDAKKLPPGVLLETAVQASYRRLFSGPVVWKSTLKNIKSKKVLKKDFFMIGVLLKRDQPVQPRYVWEFAEPGDRTLDHVLEHLGEAAMDTVTLRGNPDALWFEDGTTNRVRTEAGIKEFKMECTDREGQPHSFSFTKNACGR